jgi:hypothetical protein
MVAAKIENGHLLQPTKEIGFECFSVHNLHEPVPQNSRDISTGQFCWTELVYRSDGGFAEPVIRRITNGKRASRKLTTASEILNFLAHSRDSEDVPGACSPYLTSFCANASIVVGPWNFSVPELPK